MWLILDQISTLSKEKIVCTYDDIFQIPDYTVCQFIKSHNQYFDFYIDINKLESYNDNTLFRLILARSEKDIFKCLRKPLVYYLPEFKNGIYKIITDLYDSAPILNTVDMINKIGKMSDLVHNITFILSDKRQLKQITKFIDSTISYNIVFDYEPSANIAIQNSTIIITDDIDLIISSFQKDPIKRYLVPITGYLSKKVDDTYIFNDNNMNKIRDFTLISAVTFYQSFNFEQKHLI